MAINSNSLYLSLRVSAIDNQESNIKSSLAGPNQSLSTVVTLVCVCRTDPTQYSTPFNFLSQPIFRIVSITLGFYSSTIHLFEHILAVDCMFSHVGIAFNNCKPCEQQCFPNSSAAVTLFSSVNSHENIFNLATGKNKTALMAATSKKYGLLKEFLLKWR